MDCDRGRMMWNDGMAIINICFWGYLQQFGDLFKLLCVYKSLQITKIKMITTGVLGGNVRLFLTGIPAEKSS